MTMTARALRRAEHDRAAARRARQAARARPLAERSTIPAHGFLHAGRPRRAPAESTTAFVDVPRVRSGPTVARPRRRDSTIPTSSTPSTRCWSPIAARSRSGRASRTGRRAGGPRGLDRRPPASRRSAASRRPGPSRAATRSGCAPDLLCIGRTLRTNDAAGVDQLAALVGGDVRVFDVPYWRGPGRAGPPPVASSRRSPTTSRSSTCRSCRSGCGSSSATSTSGSSRSPTRSTRRSAATCWRCGPAS